MILHLGNDVVDLADAANRTSAANPAFRKRVLSAHERVRVPAGSDRALWAYWAAKETAYKALKPTQPALVFAHRHFAVRTSATFAETTGRASGSVDVQRQSVDVLFEWTREWVHCVTRHTPAADYRVALIETLRQEPRFAKLAQREQLADESVAARVLAHSMLEQCGIEGARIERVRRTQRAVPPVVVHPTRDVSSVALSLSHDSRYVAAALFV